MKRRPHTPERVVRKPREREKRLNTGEELCAACGPIRGVNRMGVVVVRIFYPESLSAAYLLPFALGVTCNMTRQSSTFWVPVSIDRVDCCSPAFLRLGQGRSCAKGR